MRNERRLAEGITMWMRGEDGPDAVAASQLVAETIIMWRMILETKIQKN